MSIRLIIVLAELSKYAMLWRAAPKRFVMAWTMTVMAVWMRIYPKHVTEVHVLEQRLAKMVNGLTAVHLIHAPVPIILIVRHIKNVVVHVLPHQLKFVTARIITVMVT